MLRGSAERPARARDRHLPTGVVTFLFTDVEGSTALLRRLGPRYVEVLDAHNQIIRAAVEANGGTEIRTEGDAFFCAFPNASDALAACLEAQRRLSRHDWPVDGVVKTRMGLHTGEAEEGGDDYISLAVHQAARVVDAAHGGQVLVSEATRVVAADQLPAATTLEPLGRYRLRDFPEPPLLHVLRHPELPSEFPAVRAVPAAAHNVPEQATLFVGRDTALRELTELVAGRRLVTVLGAGGVGKTRLATELVPLVTGNFPDGVWMIELARLERGDAVAPEVATILGVRAEADRAPEDSVADALASRRLLLVLDNCEHVLDAVGDLVQRLIARCAEVNVLATSRVPLGLAAERRYPLSPLRVPGADEAGDVASSEAVALFVERARVVAPGFDLGRDEQSVVDICRRLDGLPLAIELAAARTASIPPARIAQRLDRRFSVLRQTYRGALPHHATLHASIEWSFDLLEEDERVLLRRLGAFTGEFDLEAAEAVCGAQPLTPDDVLDLLARLVEKSLVARTEDRYTMLETIREFARERLEEAGEGDALATAHLAYYTGVVEGAAAEANGPGQRDAYDRLDADLPNIRAAVLWALERSDAAALRLGAALAQYGFVRNRLAEVARWCTSAVAAAPDAPPGLRARALIQAAFADVVMGAAARGQQLAREAVELARAGGDERLLVETLLMAADLDLESGSVQAARPLAAEALERLSALEHDWLHGRGLVITARAHQDEADPAATHAQLTEALERFTRAGDRRQMGRVLLTMAFVSLAAGTLEEAEAEAQRCIELCAELEHSIGQAVVRIVLIWVALERGATARARELLVQSAAVACDSGYVALVGYCGAALAALLAAEGDDEAAARVLGALSVTDGALGAEGGAELARRVQVLGEEVRQRLGGPAFAAAHQAGTRERLEAVIAQRGR